MLTFSTTLCTMFALRSASAFVAKSQVRSSSARAFRPTVLASAKEGQAEVVLVGCGAPNRGMGWVSSIATTVHTRVSQKVERRKTDQALFSMIDHTIQATRL